MVKMSLSALRKLLPPSHSPSSPSHAPFLSLSPTSGTRRDRIALLDRTTAFLSTGTSSNCVQLSRDESIAALLHSYLTQSSHAPILSSLSSLLSTPLLSSIASAIQRTPDRAKRQLSSLVTPHYHRSTLKALNFPLSPSAYTTAQRHARINGVGSPPPCSPLPPSKQPPSPSTLQSLANFLDSHSQPAACRTVKVNKCVVPARILSHQYAELHREWLASQSSLLSLTSFIRAVRSLRVYKPVSKRMTDMCDHCMEGRRHDALLRKRLQQHQQPSCPFAMQVQQLLEQYQATDAVPPVPSTVELPPCSCSDVSEDDVTAARALLPVVCFYFHHRVLKEQRHQLYSQQQTDLTSSDDRVVITLDYKQNIKLNVGPEEESHRFYAQAHRTVLGFLCQYKDRATGRLVNHYVDYISPCLTHDAAFVLECLQDLVVTFLLPRGLHHLDVWTDCGAHFRCKEMLAGVCAQLPIACRSLNVPLTANLHYFMEKHGKSAVDGHFSLLSRWLREAAAQHDIVSTADLKHALVQQSTAHLQATRSTKLPDHRCNFRFYTPLCQQHSGAYHESLAPASSDPVHNAWPSDTAVCTGLGTAVVGPSLSLDGDELEASVTVLDEDGDVQMSESQWASQPSDCSFTSIASSPPSFSPLPSYDSESLDEAAADDVVAVAAADADAPMGEEERVTVFSDLPVLSVIGAASAERRTSGAAADVPAAMHSRVEGRVHCTRPHRRRPSIEMPRSSSIALNTHYDWSCSSLPEVTLPPSSVSCSSSSSSCSSSSSSSSFPSSSSSSTAVPMKKVTTADIHKAIAAQPSSCPVTLSVSVLPDSPVWPEQSKSAMFQSELCTSKEYISFAPRLQAMPDVVLHPHAHSAMRKRLQSTHDAISYIEALKACDMAEAFPN